MNEQELLQKKRDIEELKSKKQRLEERFKMLNEQKQQVEAECEELGVKPESLDELVIKLGKEIEDGWNKVREALGKIRI